MPYWVYTYTHPQCYILLFQCIFCVLFHFSNWMDLKKNSNVWFERTRWTWFISPLHVAYVLLPMIPDKVQNIPWLIPLPSRALINLNRKKINSDFADGLANQGRWMIQSECLLWFLWRAFRMNAWARTGSYQKTKKKQKQKKTGTHALRISLFPLSAAFQANNFERNLKFFAFINLDIKKKKRQKTAKPCVQSIYSQIAVNTDDCVGRRYHCLQLCLGCQWGIWGAGWGRQEGLGAVIKLPLFPPGSLQGSNSALIG